MSKFQGLAKKFKILVIKVELVNFLYFWLFSSQFYSLLVEQMSKFWLFNVKIGQKIWFFGFSGENCPVHRSNIVKFVVNKVKICQNFKDWSIF